MIDLQLIFLDENGTQVPVLSSMPAVPSAGDLLRFYDSDREVELEGRVHFVEYDEHDGELTIKVHTQRP